MTYRNAISLFAFLSLGLAAPAIAQDAGTVSITVEQVNAENTFGNWTILRPGNSSATMTKQSHTFNEEQAGTFTISARAPEGASATMELYIDGELSKSLDIPQVTFTLTSGQAARLVITHTFTRTGTVGVGSTPPGLSFTLKGPNNLNKNGVTPASFPNTAIGLYSAYFDTIEGCADLRPISGRLEKNGRVQLNVNLDCEGLQNLESVQDQNKTLEFVTVNINGKTVVFQDVPLDRWYSNYIHTVAKTNIISGYQNTDGTPSGTYGPSDNVTIGQLLKIAHRLAGIDETPMRAEPRNTFARGAWYSQFFASAEKMDWRILRDIRLDPNRPATRAEVVATLLQALDVPRIWAKGNVFTDVPSTYLYADSIESGAEYGLVTGFSDSNGKATGRFGPNEPINRAEIAKMVSIAIDLFISNTPEITGKSY